MGRIFKPFLKKLGWVDYRERYEINLELLLQRIHQGNELKREKNAAVQAAQELITKVSEMEQRERHAVGWAGELEKRVEHLEKECMHALQTISLINQQLIRERQQTGALITAAVELNKQVATWKQAINNIKNNFPEEWDNATTPKTTN